MIDYERVKIMKIKEGIKYLIRLCLFGLTRYRALHKIDDRCIVMDLVKGIAYDAVKNEVSKIENFPNYSDIITKKEFLALFKNNRCKCEFDSGNKIVKSRKAFDVVEEFNKIYSTYYIENRSNYGYFVYKDTCLDSYESLLLPKDYFKGACLKCNTCTSDLKDLHFEFDRAIEGLNKGIRRQIEIEPDRITIAIENKINEICDGGL